MIVISARTGEDDIKAALSLGADDYMVKPFTASDLAERVRTLLLAPGSREPEENRTTGRSDPLRGPGSVRPIGSNADLTAVESRLLYELAAAPGVVVRRHELLHRIWGHDQITAQWALDARMSSLRSKMEADPDRPQLLLAGPGGYTLAP